MNRPHIWIARDGNAWSGRNATLHADEQLFVELRRRIERRIAWRRRVQWFCVGVSIFTTLYFVGQLLRAFA